MCDIPKPLPRRANLQYSPLALRASRPGPAKPQALRTTVSAASSPLPATAPQLHSPTKLLQDPMDLDNDKQLQELAAVERDVLGVPRSFESPHNPFEEGPLAEDVRQNVVSRSPAPTRHSYPSLARRVWAPERPTNPIVKDSQWLRMQEDSTESGDDSCMEPIPLAYPICSVNNQWESDTYCRSFEDTAAQL